MNKENIQTVSNLHDDLSKLVNNGLGERVIYESIEANGFNQLVPFNKKLVVPTVLDKALTDSELNEKHHILFM